MNITANEIPNDVTTHERARFSIADIGLGYQLSVSN
jgi:hypothetical protein